MLSTTFRTSDAMSEKERPSIRGKDIKASVGGSSRISPVEFNWCPATASVAITLETQRYTLKITQPEKNGHGQYF